MKTPKLELKVNTLEKSLDRLKAENKVLYEESAQRGKEFEKLRRIIIDWKAQLPEVFLENCREVIREYEARCTKTKRKRPKK